MPAPTAAPGATSTTRRWRTASPRGTGFGRWRQARPERSSVALPHRPVPSGPSRYPHEFIACSARGGRRVVPVIGPSLVRRGAYTTLSAIELEACACGHMGLSCPPPTHFPPQGIASGIPLGVGVALGSRVERPLREEAGEGFALRFTSSVIDPELYSPHDGLGNPWRSYRVA